MTPTLERRLLLALEGSPLANRVGRAVESFLELRSEDASLADLDPPRLVGLARVLASQPEVAGFLAHRPELLERIARADRDTLDARARELAERRPESDIGDLEEALDALRLLRREETCLAACLDLGGLIDFETVSTFLSIVAETIAGRALALARHAGATPPRTELSVIGMGKIAGRELTYHSDLDLIFLFGGGPEEVTAASRVGQRLIAYLTTMTGAGIAYAVDARLRPSGRQGMLVTSFEAFERYQSEQARIWEHVAMLRARAVAGVLEPGEATLERVRHQLLSTPSKPWPELVELRRRVEIERAEGEEGAVPFKTGAGGMMDVDYLAGGGLLEREGCRYPALPSVPALLRAAASGPRVEAVLEDYGFLRRVEARARWLAGRGVEFLPGNGPEIEVVAELVQPGLGGEALLERVASARERIRAGYDAVVDARTIGALEA